jgi:hypothetical protein
VETTLLKINIRVGDKFFGSHGDAAEGSARNELIQLLELLKKLEAADNLILCNIPSVRQVEVMKNTIMMMKQPKILLTEK